MESTYLEKNEGKDAETVDAYHNLRVFIEDQLGVYSPPIEDPLCFTASRVCADETGNYDEDFSEVHSHFLHLNSMMTHKLNIYQRVYVIMAPYEQILPDEPVSRFVVFLWGSHSFFCK